MIITLCILGWLACSIHNFGACQAYFVGKFPQTVSAADNCAFAFVMALTGPIGLPAVLLGSYGYKHGWSLWPKGKQ